MSRLFLSRDIEDENGRAGRAVHGGWQLAATLQRLGRPLPEAIALWRRVARGFAGARRLPGSCSVPPALLQSFLAAVWAEIYLCDVCSCQEVSFQARGGTRRGMQGWRAPARAIASPRSTSSRRWRHRLGRWRSRSCRLATRC
jgi:hypothetical protein